MSRLANLSRIAAAAADWRPGDDAKAPADFIETFTPATVVRLLDVADAARDYLDAETDEDVDEFGGRLRDALVDLEIVAIDYPID